MVRKSALLQMLLHRKILMSFRTQKQKLPHIYGWMAFVFEGGVLFVFVCKRDQRLETPGQSTLLKC